MTDIRLNRAWQPPVLYMAWIARPSLLGGIALFLSVAVAILLRRASYTGIMVEMLWEPMMIDRMAELWMMRNRSGL